MFPLLRDLQSSHPDGVEAVVESVNHVVRSEVEIKARTIVKKQDKDVPFPMHFLVFLRVGETVYADVVDVDTDRELTKGDPVKVRWTQTAEGDGMPFLS